MQSDPGAGSPQTGGNDEEIWLDLVARLEDVEDSFMSEPGLLAPPETGRSEPKRVQDFDPLGVWAAQPAADDGDTSASGPRDYAVEDSADDFVPGEPPVLRNTEPAIMLSWIGAVGGPLFLVFASIFWRQAPMILVIGVIMAFLGGAGYLLFRLPDHRDDSKGDGAVV